MPASRDTLVDVSVGEILGSLPQATASPEPTVKRCIECGANKSCATCGQESEAERVRNFNLGIKHCLNVLFRKLVKRGMLKHIATHLVLWIEGDVEL